MPVYRPSELIEFLTLHGLNPKKSLSQNFLIDGNVLKKIVSISHIEKDDLILEIGPGPGALTEQLLDAGARVIAVEKDKELSTLLQRLDLSSNKLTIFNEDILDFLLQEKLSSFLKENEKAKVIANLPYHLTSPILEKLIPRRDLFSKIIVMVQEEVARRFTALPSTSDYGSFTIFLNYYTNPHYSFHVKKNSFLPAPKVDSAIVTFELKEPKPLSNIESFFKCTRTAFQQRRKTLKSSLKDLYKKEKIEETLLKLHLNPMARPEELSLIQFIDLFESLEKNP